MYGGSIFFQFILEHHNMDKNSKEVHTDILPSGKIEGLQ